MSDNASNPQDPLAQATSLVKTGRLEDAQKVLIQYLSKNPASEQAWLLMSFVVSNPLQQKDCLERVLKINPDNHVAQSKLARLSQPLAGSPPNAAPPVPPPAAAPRAFAAPSDSEAASATGKGKPTDKPLFVEPSKPAAPQNAAPAAMPGVSRNAPPPPPPKKTESEIKQLDQELSAPPKITKTGKTPSTAEPVSEVANIGAVFKGASSHSPFRRENLLRIGLIALGAILVIGLAFAVLTNLITPLTTKPTSTPTLEPVIFVPTFPPTWTPTRTSTITPTSTATATSTGTPTSTPQFTATKTLRK